MPARHRYFGGRLAGNTKAMVGLAIVGFFLLLAIVGPWVAPYDPSQRSADLLQPPSARHWFGTTNLGQDIFSQVLVGARSVLFIGFVAGVVATVLAASIGVTAGYLGGLADEGLSVLSNVFLVVPAIPLIIIISTTLQDSSTVTVVTADRVYLVGVGGTRTAGADAVFAAPRLRRGR